MDYILWLAGDIANLKGQRSRTARWFRAFFRRAGLLLVIAALLAIAVWMYRAG